MKVEKSYVQGKAQVGQRKIHPYSTVEMNVRDDVAVQVFSL